jgi:hypothetical protein
MIKAFAPMLGNFHGDGVLADGTELIGVLEGHEALENVAYSFRANLVAQDSGQCLLDAYFVLSNTADCGMEIQFYDTRGHIHKLTWMGGGRGNGDIASHLFRFEGQRDNGSAVRLSFELTSAAKCRVRFESMGRRGEWREHWGLDLERRQDISRLRAA